MKHHFKVMTAGLLNYFKHRNSLETQYLWLNEMIFDSFLIIWWPWPFWYLIGKLYSGIRDSRINTLWISPRSKNIVMKPWLKGMGVVRMIFLWTFWYSDIWYFSTDSLNQMARKTRLWNSLTVIYVVISFLFAWGPYDMKPP